MQAALFLGKDAGVDTSKVGPALKRAVCTDRLCRDRFGTRIGVGGSFRDRCPTNFRRTGEPGASPGRGWVPSIDPETRRRPGVQEALIRGALEDPDPKVRADRSLPFFLVRTAMRHAWFPWASVFSDTNAQARWMGAKLLSSQAQSPDARIALERALHDTVDRAAEHGQEALKRPALVPAERAQSSVPWSTQ